METKRIFMIQTFFRLGGVGAALARTISHNGGLVHLVGRSKAPLQGSRVLSKYILMS